MKRTAIVSSAWRMQSLLNRAVSRFREQRMARQCLRLLYQRGEQEARDDSPAADAIPGTYFELISCR